MKTSRPAIDEGFAAVIGYTYDRGGIMVRICSWCPDKAEAERRCRQSNQPMTHGICPSCYAKMIGDR